MQLFNVKFLKFTYSLLYMSVCHNSNIFMYIPPSPKRNKYTIYLKVIFLALKIFNAQ